MTFRNGRRALTRLIMNVNRLGQLYNNSELQSDRGYLAF
jgi:hypothetical protein